MNMNIGQIIDRVRKTIGEPARSNSTTSSTWTDQQIAGYVNECIGLLANDYRKDAYAILPISTQDQVDNGYVNLPDDCLEDGLRKLTYHTPMSAYPMKYLIIDQFLQMSSNIFIPASSIYNNQRFYTIWVDEEGVEQIKFQPRPVSNQDFIEIYYYRKLNEIDLTGIDGTYTNTAYNQIPDIPTRFHIALVEYAIMECQAAVEELTLSSVAQQKFDRYRMQFIQEQYRNQRDQGVRARARGQNR